MKPEEKALQLQKTRTSVKRKAQEITEESVRKMVCQEALKSNLIIYQDVKGLKDTFYRERLKLIQKLPTCKEEVLEARMQMDRKDYNFSICKSNKEYGIALLTTEESLLFLSNSHRMLGDETFKSCPKFFFNCTCCLQLCKNFIMILSMTFITLLFETNETTKLSNAATLV